MSYFSRLTDIVTCNLSKILSEETDPYAAIARIIDEMKEGLAGAQRSVATAQHNENDLELELAESWKQLDTFSVLAKTELAAGNETRAREALLRKQEVHDLIAGLEQQHHAAKATREHLETTLRAIEARLAEASRKQDILLAAQPGTAKGEDAVSPIHTSSDDARSRRVDEELELLKRELKGG